MKFLSISFAIFMSVLCDNLLLTVVVPILPELLRENEERLNPTYRNLLQNDTDFERKLKDVFHLQMLNENSQLGLLFSTKAIMQLICNPLVGQLTQRIGYKVPLFIGNFILFLCALVFGFADSYIFFLLGRSFHGLASSLIMISGMALIAELYSDNESDRTKFLGRVMGAAALGVLIGYPFGGFLYEFLGKTSPFICIGLLALFNTGLHAYRILTSGKEEEEEDVTEGTWSTSSLYLSIKKSALTRQKSVTQSQIPPLPTDSTWSLFRNSPKILIISISIWLSTMSMSTLEPTLPIWLISNLDPPKWQLGLIFVPDSLGYFIGTNFFGQFALVHGRSRISFFSLCSIGIACFILPLASKVWQLAMPHFVLGLGLGIIDASLMPLLAKIADEKHNAGYGAIYALAQTSVALAYSLGPLVGGESVRIIGFPNMIRSVGLLNLLFSPFVLILHEDEEEEDVEDVEEYNQEAGMGENMQTLKDFTFLRTILERGSKSLQKEKSTDGQEPPPSYRRFNDDFDSD